MTAQSTTYPVSANIRTILGKQVRQLRTQGLIPGVVYGHGKESVSISIEGHSFTKLFREAGSSTLLDLSIDGGKAQKVLVHDISIHPVKGQILHVDFYTVNMKEKLQTEIPLEFVGESAAVTNEDGTLITVKTEVNVECLPQDLVHSIEVDISSLATFDDSIRIEDIKVPAGIVILDEPEEVVASVTPPRSEEEMAELEEVPDATLDVESETQSGTDAAPGDEEATEEEK